MPPWRKGQGLGPFTSARPVAGPLLSSQLAWPQTTQNSRSRRSWPRQCALVARGQSRCPADAVRLPTDLGPPTGRTPLALSGVDRYGGGSGASRSKARSTPTAGPDVGARPAATHVGWESMPRQLSAASPGEPRDRPSGSGVGARFGCRTVSPRRCAAAVIRAGVRPSEVWRGTRRLLLRRGEQAPAVSGTKSSSCLCGGCQATGPPVFPLHSAFGMPSSARQRLSQPAGERALWHCVCPPSSSSGLAPGATLKGTSVDAELGRTTGTATSSDRRSGARRLSTETKAAYKTTEFLTYVVVFAGILVASFLVKTGQDGQTPSGPTRPGGTSRS
jgi:hypothetical protein